MRDHSKHIRLTREEAISRLLERAELHPTTELVSLRDALWRVSAAGCTARVDVPNATCSQMDGIAVRFDDFAEGIPDTSRWKAGRDFGWANTGCAMPEGFDTVIPIESVRFPNAPVLGETDPGAPEVLEAPKSRGERCRERGAEHRVGDIVVAAHERLTPTKLSLLAMCGVSEVSVVSRPRVAFIPTGSELVPIGGPLPEGKAYDSNSVLLEGKLRAWGANPVMFACVPDDPDGIRDALLRACAGADIVVICAGSSKGEHDYTMEVLEDVGEVICHETNHGPGLHTSASLVHRTAVLGLSGPPAGFEITADWYLKPLVDTYLYGSARPFDTVNACLAPPEKGPASGHGARGGFRGNGMPPDDFFAIRPVRLSSEDGMLVATPVAGGPHPDLGRLDEADGYLEAHPRTLHELHAGDTVSVELRYPYRRL